VHWLAAFHLPKDVTLQTRRCRQAGYTSCRSSAPARFLSGCSRPLSSPPTARWQWVTVGSVFAAVTWIIASFLFSWYLASFANYNATYGSLGAAVGVMIWLWISNTVMLLGAELNAEIEHQTARDSTVGAEKPLGARGAVMADTVGALALDPTPRAAVLR
jgi:membrane protein implicated in regulation of membrane protease activity